MPSQSFSLPRCAPLAFVALFSAAVAPSQVGTISGKVFDQKGTPLSNISVTAIALAVPPLRATATSSATGNFAISTLPLGTYRLCASDPRRQYLDPCWWSDPMVESVTATITSARSADGITLRLKPASLLQIRINDPQGLLAGPHPRGGLMAGVFTTSRLYLDTYVRSRDVGGTLLEVSIPFDEPVRLLVSGIHVALIDNTNTPVGPRGATLIVANSSAAAAPAAP